MATKKTEAAPAPGPTPAWPLVPVRALTPLRHDGVDYAEQQVFELPEEEAQALVAGGYVALHRADPTELSLA